MTIAAVVTAAGLGTRLGSDLPKALVRVAGRPLVAHALDRILTVASVVVVTAVPEQLSAFVAAVEGRADVVAGGDTRQDSVWAGLAGLAGHGVGGDDVVLIHDAARAFMPAAPMLAAVAAIRAGADAAVPVIPVVDTLVAAPGVDGAYGAGVDRDELRAVQTPQAFRMGVITAAHQATLGLDATDDATLVRDLGYRVVATAGHPWGLKVTHAGDLALASYIAEQP